MCRDDSSSRLLHDHTRGSTDDKLIYFWDRNRQAWDKANRIRGLAWHGFNQTSKELHLWPVDPPVNLRGRLRIVARRLRDALLAESQIDSLLLERLEPADFWAKVRQFNPARISAFPSALVAMIQRDQSIAADSNIPALRAVFLTGEVTFPWQQCLIEQTLRVPCIQSYGIQEAGAIAYECPRRSWHICAESMFVEFIRDNHKALPGELAEVVVTGLQSRAMPVIRYRTGDIVRVRRESCDCGLSLPVMPRILGRISDFLITDNGHWIEPACAIEALSPIFGNGAFQIEQNSNGSLQVQVLDRACAPEDWSSRLSAALQGLFGHRVAFTIQRIPGLHRSEFGKCRYVHSKALPDG
ncbi:MAG: hypothetical protein IPK83_06540 [Planctomycetes bacterium]|nr:hypothetical protein [Planctomycetota bacterium]